VLVFGTVIDKDGTPYSGDLRGCSRAIPTSCSRKSSNTLNAATRSRASSSRARDAERHFHETGKFEFINRRLLHVLPLDPLRQSSTLRLRYRRAMGFQNEKDHPEVAPSHSKSTTVTPRWWRRQDQIQSLQTAYPADRQHMGFTASLLPKPVVG